MSQPPNYTPTTDFSQQEAINTSGRSTVNTAALDTEFANIEQTLDQTLSNLALLQRDDGRLKDVIVDVYTLAPDVLNLIGGFNLRGLWSAATAYALNDICSNDAYTYVCKTAHTSGGTFDAQYWIQFGFTSGADAAQAAAAAQTSATAAASSATSAASSATAAASSATSASGSAVSASSSASAATTKASEASSSATSASNSAAAAAASAAAITFPIPVTSGGTGAANASSARTNLGLGTAATLNVGTAANNVVQLDSSAKLPALDASQLTGFYASSAENAAGAIENKAVDPLGIREAFNATGSAPVFACRAWVNFNGTGTPSIRASGNVSSITDNGVGDYTINFATSMPDTNYSVGGIASMADNVGSATDAQINPRRAGSVSSSSVRVLTSYNNSGTQTLIDCGIVCAQIYR